MNDLAYWLSRNLTSFIKNEKAVIGLPMRLTVSLVIGAVALTTILFFILNPCLFPGKLMVSVDPMVNVIPSPDNSITLDLVVYVRDTEGRPIMDASIIIDGLGGAGSNYTDANGRAVVSLTATLESGINEGYLDVIVKARCHETFSQDDMVKVARG